MFLYDTVLYYPTKTCLLLTPRLYLMQTASLLYVTSSNEPKSISPQIQKVQLTTNDDQAPIHVSTLLDSIRNIFLTHATIKGLLILHRGTSLLRILHYNIGPPCSSVVNPVSSCVQKQLTAVRQTLEAVCSYSHTIRLVVSNLRVVTVALNETYATKTNPKHQIQCQIFTKHPAPYSF